MASINRIIFGCLILQLYVHAAPGDVSKLEDIAKVEHNDANLDSEPKDDKSDNNSTETNRQKRWYNPYGYGFPPVTPSVYPTYNKRDEGSNTGYYGEDPLVQIHRRILEIANIVRQPPPPPPPQIPIFYPVLFIPPGDCNCEGNTTPGSNNPSLTDNNDTTPSVTSRWPEMEDDRQNWGFVITKNDTDDDREFSRPISFDPISLDRPTRPAPPVEHGTVQSDSSNTQGSNNIQGSASSETTSFRPPPSQNAGVPQGRPQDPPSSERKPPGLAPPSACDGAILVCCHQPHVSYDCFAVQGCPDFTSYGSPCDPSLILRVVERFQTYYGRKSG